MLLGFPFPGFRRATSAVAGATGPRCGDQPIRTGDGIELYKQRAAVSQGRGDQGQVSGGIGRSGSQAEWGAGPRG